MVHPHPAMGGDRHHPLVVAMADGLAAAGVAALRLDLEDPDVTTSAEALSTAATELAVDIGVEQLFLVGYSWGSVVSSLAAPSGLVARVLVAPPVAGFVFAASDDLPALVLVPAHDQYGGPAAVDEAMGDWAHTTIETVDGCDHFLAGAVGRIATRAVEWLSTQP